MSVQPQPSAISLKDITGLVLSGGRATRMGGIDKGLQPFRGVALTQHTLQRLQAQSGGPVGALMVNANRNADVYAKFGAPVWPDALDGQVDGSLDRQVGLAQAPAEAFAGPLAGFLSGLAHCHTTWLLTVPCDSPLFPFDLVQRLAHAAEQANADIAMVAAPETKADGQTVVRPQPVFCLLKASLRGSLAAFMAGGGRKIDTWTGQHAFVLVPFNLPGDDPLAFANANTLAQLQALEQTPQPAP